MNTSQQKAPLERGHLRTAQKGIADMTSVNTLDFAGKAIRQDALGFICLTDMWKASGESRKRSIHHFMASPATQELLAESLKCTDSGQMLQHKQVRTERGRYGGTWGTKELAIAYAKYLSPKFHLWALKVIRERMEEEADPELGIHRATDRAKARWKGMGHSEQWIANRLRGISVRNELTTLCQSRGFRFGQHYANVTNALYIGLFGQNAGDIRESRGLPEKCNVRDAMDSNEILATALAENLTRTRAEEQRLWGASDICDAANHCGNMVAVAVKGAITGKVA